MKTIILQLFISFLALSQSPEPDTQRLREFVRDALAQKLTNTEIEDRYFCPTILHRPDKYGDKARQGAEWALTMQRQFLREQRVVAAEVTFTPYDELPASEVPPKPFHMLGETKQVYVAQYQRKIVLYLLMQDHKIASTLLLGQGDEHYFLDFCH